MRRLVAGLAVGLSGLLCVPVAASAAPVAEASIRWHDCNFDQPASPRVQCAEVAVPVDWSRPDGPKIDVAVDRLPALDQEHRIGSLLLNPGGPGGSGVDVVAQGGMFLPSPDLKVLQERFDLVGFDPRGVGRSSPITCAGNLMHDPTVTAFPRTQTEYERLVRLSADAGRSCTPRNLLPHVDTISVARDVDAIRTALGERTISWLGVSYGTELGQAYAALYPRRVRAMVLDGAVDHTRSTARAAVDESAAIEQEFHRFAAWCDRTADCALHGHDVTALLDELNVRADRGQVQASVLHRTVTAEEVTEGAYNGLYATMLWPQLAEALAKAAGVGAPADASELVAAAAFVAPAYYAPYRAVGCQDFPPRLSGLADLRARAAAVRAVAPHMWRYSEFWDWTAGCAGWPVPAANPPRPTHVTGAPPILVVGNVYDPSTPYPWARSLTAQIDRSVLLTDVVDGHTGLYNSACARTHEAAYLVSRRTPPPGTICRD